MVGPIACDSSHRLTVRRLEAGDAADYRELRLESLKRHPEAFSTAWESDAEQPASWWTERLETSAVFGGWVDASPLVGVVRFTAEDAAKLRHKGLLSGLYVRPQARRAGLAAALVREVIAHARPRVEQLCLTVVTGNGAARRLYEAAGFAEYGIEPRSLKVGDHYYDEALMVLPLTPRPEAAPGRL